MAIFRVPLPLYRAGWGWLLGNTFLLLVEESFAVALEFRRRHPWRLRLLSRVLGWDDPGFDEAVRNFIHTRPFVALRPAQPAR